MNKNSTIGEILLKAGRHGLTLQLQNGSMPAGHNGPYRDPEHPIRNTAHWLYLFSHLYQKTKETCWKTASEKAIDYVFGKEARPFGKTFYCRDKKDKDRCNGLVGQAWVIEALVKASEVFGREDCYKLAEETLLLHPFDKKASSWHRVDIDGTILDFDDTFNHQLWFAAAGSLLCKTPVAVERSRAFLTNVASRVQLYRNGTIFHGAPLVSLMGSSKYGIHKFLKVLKLRLNKKRYDRLYSKSAGYHGFNLYAFAMMKKVFPDENIWKSPRFSRILNVRNNPAFQADMVNSEFAYRYNISGIEIAYAVQAFINNDEEEKQWFERQLKETFMDDKNILSNRVADENTAMARIYQAARLKPDLKISFQPE